MINIKLNRNKIRFIIVFVLLGTLSLYFWLASKNFEDEKLADALKSSQSFSAMLATQIKSQFLKNISTTESIFKDFSQSQKFSNTSVNSFKELENIESIAVLKVDFERKVSFSLISFLEKNPNDVSSFIYKQGANFEKLLEEIKNNDQILRNPFNDDRVLFLQKNFNKNSSDLNYISMALFKWPEIEEIFYNRMESKNIFLCSKNGKIIFGPPSFRGQNISKILNLKNQGKDEFEKNGISSLSSYMDEEHLVTTSRIGFGDVYLLTVLSKKEIIKSLKVSTQKSFLFFAILFCLIILTTLIHSDSLFKSIDFIFETKTRILKQDLKKEILKSNHFEQTINLSNSLNPSLLGSISSNSNRRLTHMNTDPSKGIHQLSCHSDSTTDLTMVHQLQEKIFPQAMGSLGNISLHGFFEGANRVNQDWWHCSNLGSTLIFWIGQLPGKGIESAIIASAIKSAISIIERLQTTPSTAMQILNRSIYDVTKGYSEVSFFIASYDMIRKEITYSNASHVPPFLIRGCRIFNRARDFVPLNRIQDPKLGKLRDICFKEECTNFGPGDSLFLYTEGMRNIRNFENGKWGTKVFETNLIESFKGQFQIKDSLEIFLKAVKSSRGMVPLNQDITFCVIRNEESIFG